MKIDGGGECRRMRSALIPSTEYNNRDVVISHTSLRKNENMSVGLLLHKCNVLVAFKYTLISSVVHIILTVETGFDLCVKMCDSTDSFCIRILTQVPFPTLRYQEYKRCPHCKSLKGNR